MLSFNTGPGKDTYFFPIFQGKEMPGKHIRSAIYHIGLAPKWQTSEVDQANVNYTVCHCQSDTLCVPCINLSIQAQPLKKKKKNAHCQDLKVVVLIPLPNTLFETQVGPSTSTINSKSYAM